MAEPLFLAPLMGALVLWGMLQPLCSCSPDGSGAGQVLGQHLKLTTLSSLIFFGFKDGEGVRLRLSAQI